MDDDETVIEHVLGFGDLRTCFPELSLDCIEELADACAVRIRISEFGEFDFEVDASAKSIITKHTSGEWYREHLREACHLAMTIPVS
jgi:hypothetical protein